MWLCVTRGAVRCVVLYTVRYIVVVCNTWCGMLRWCVNISGRRGGIVRWSDPQDGVMTALSVDRALGLPSTLPCVPPSPSPYPPPLPAFSTKKRLCYEPLLPHPPLPHIRPAVSGPDFLASYALPPPPPLHPPPSCGAWCAVV